MPTGPEGPVKPAFEAACAHVPSKTRPPSRQREKLASPPGPNRPAGAPDPGDWAARIAISSAQVTYGCRPVMQMHRWVTREIFDTMKGEVRRVRPGSRELNRIHFHVRRVRVSEPAFGVAEAAVVLDDGRRPYAVAMRLEWRRNRWLACILDVL